jgi:transposase, IS30 family
MALKRPLKLKSLLKIIPFEAGLAQKEIANLMDHTESTISSEIKRNSLPKGGYKPASADRIALSRRRRQSMLERLSPLGQHVRDCLAMGHSPEQIAGRLRLDQSKHIVSHETIYRYIYRPKIRPDKLYRYLPRSKAKRGRRYYKCRREPLSHKRSIHQRPACVEQRIEFGHWEGDLMNFSTLPLIRLSIANNCAIRSSPSLAMGETVAT